MQIQIELLFLTAKTYFPEWAPILESIGMDIDLEPAMIMTQIKGAISEKYKSCLFCCVVCQNMKPKVQPGEYKRFYLKMDLKQQRQRIYFDMGERVAPDIRKSRNIVPKLEKTYNIGSLLEKDKEFDYDETT